MIVNKAYKYRLYPNKEQISFINKTFGCTRFIYNKMLDFRINDYKNNKDIDGYKFKKTTPTELKKEFDFLKEISVDTMWYESKFLDKAYQNFFRNPQVNGFPRFKSKYDAPSFSDKGRALNFSPDSKYITIPKLRKSPIKIIMHRPLEGRPVTFTISRTPSQEYYISIQCEVEVIDYVLPTTNKNVGIDLGLTDFAILSDGTKIENPRFLLKSAQKLAKEQRVLSKRMEMAKKEKRKLEDSKNYQKQKLKVAKLHSKVARQRSNFIHTLTKQLVEEYDIISLETLKSKEMMQDKQLARSISDVSWFDFLTKLKYKADWNGRTVVQIDQFFPSSQLCSSCGHNDGKKELSIREWTCSSCGEHHDRDINASLNILNEGLRILGDDKN